MFFAIILIYLKNFFNVLIEYKNFIFLFNIRIKKNFLNDSFYLFEAAAAATAAERPILLFPGLFYTFLITSKFSS